MPYRLSWLTLLALLNLGACTNSDQPAQSGRHDHVWDTQTKALDKARAAREQAEAENERRVRAADAEQTQ